MRALAILIVCAATAHAEPEDEAVRHLNLGIAAYKLGHYDDALRELTETDRLAPDRANTHRWLALVYEKLGDCKAALAHVDGYLAKVAPGDARLPELVGLRDRCLGTATLVVETTPAGAGLRLDGGALVGSTPYRMLGVHGGPHVVGLVKPGFASASRSIVVPASGELVVRVPLEPVPPARRTRWWLWAAGAAAIVAIAGVTYGVTRGDENRLPPIVCDPGACR